MQPPQAGATGGPDGPTGASPGPEWTPPPLPRRDRSPLLRWTLGTALVVVGVLWSLRIADVLYLTVSSILAAGLLVVGVGLVVSAFVGRARSLLVVGLLLMPAVLAGQLSMPSAFPDGVWSIDPDRAGEIRLAPTTVDQLDTSYELAAGTIRLDLTDLDLEGGGTGADAVELEVRVGAGRIEVLVPDDVTVTASAEMGLGAVRLFDEGSVGGLSVGPRTARIDPPDPEGVIDLDLAVGVGEIRVAVEER